MMHIQCSMQVPLHRSVGHLVQDHLLRSAFCVIIECLSFFSLIFVSCMLFCSISSFTRKVVDIVYSVQHFVEMIELARQTSLDCLSYVAQEPNSARTRHQPVSSDCAQHQPTTCSSRLQHRSQSLQPSPGPSYCHIVLDRICYHQARLIVKGQ